MPGMHGWTDEEPHVASSNTTCRGRGFDSKQKLREAHSTVSPEYRVLVHNVPIDVDECAVVSFFNGAIAAATDHDPEAFAEVVPCSDACIDHSTGDASVIFKTAVAATVAVNLTGLQFRDSVLGIVRPPEYKKTSSWDPASSLLLEEVCLASLTGQSASMSSALATSVGKTPKEGQRWYESCWRRGLTRRRPRACPSLAEERTMCTVLGIAWDSQPSEVRRGFFDRVQALRLERDEAECDIGTEAEAEAPREPEPEVETSGDAAPSEPPLPAAEASAPSPSLGSDAVPPNGAAKPDCGAGRGRPDRVNYLPRLGNLLAAYRVLSNRPRFRPLQRTLYPHEAFKGAWQHDDHATAFMLRHVVNSRGGSVVQRVEVETGTAESISRARKFLCDETGADVLVLMPRVNSADKADVLLAGTPAAIQRVLVQIDRHLEEIAGLKVPADGVVVVVPEQVMKEFHGQPLLSSATISRIWGVAGSSVRCANDRIIIKGGRVHVSVARVQDQLRWRGDVLLPDGTRHDAWGYAFLSENMQQVPDPQLVPNTEPDFPTVQRIFCLASDSGMPGLSEPLPSLGARCLQMVSSGARRLVHTVLRSAVSMAAFTAVMGSPFELQAHYLCALLRLWIGAQIRLPLEGFARHTITLIVNELRALLLDPRAGAAMRHRGHAAVNLSIPDNGLWVPWAQVLAEGGLVVIFAREVLMWLRDSRPLLGLIPTQWAEMPSIASMILWLCIGSIPGLFIDLHQGLKRTVTAKGFTPEVPPVPFNPAPPVLAKPVSQPAAPPARSPAAPAASVPGTAAPAKGSSQRLSPRRERSRSRSRRRRRESGSPRRNRSRKESKRPASSSPEGADDELVPQVEDYLLSQTAEACHTVSITRILEEAGRRLKVRNPEKLSPAWFEKNTGSFVVRAYRDGKEISEKKQAKRSRDCELRVRLTPEARAATHQRAQRAFERRCEHQQRPLLIQAKDLLAKLGSGRLPDAAADANVAAALLFHLAQDPSKFASGVAPSIAEAFQAGGKKAKQLHQDLLPFAPATVLASVVAIDEHRKEPWHENVLVLLLQCAGLELHRYTDRPRASLSTAAQTLCRACSTPFRSHIGATVLIAASSLRVEMELQEEYAMEPSSPLFCPFAQTCAWLASIFLSCALPTAQSRDVAKAFTSLAGRCSTLRLRTYDPEGLCRLCQAFDLFIEGCGKQGLAAAGALKGDDAELKDFKEKMGEARAASVDALENIAQCFLAQSVDRADTWSPDQLMLMAEACAAMQRATGRLVFGHIAALVERHSHASVTWDSDQVWRLLRLANELELLGSTKQLLQSWDDTGALLRYVLGAPPRDAPLIFAIARLLESPAVLLGFSGRCSEKSLAVLGVEGLLKLLDQWPEEGAWDMVSSFKSVVLGAAVAAASAVASSDLPRRLSLTLLSSAAAHENWSSLLTQLAEVPGVLAALPHGGQPESTLRSAREVTGPFVERSLKCPLLASAFAATLLSCLPSAALGDIQHIFSALVDLMSIEDLLGMPAVLAAVAEAFVEVRLQCLASNSGLPELLGLLTLIVQSVEREVVAAEGPMARWVASLEALACDAAFQGSAPVSIERLERLAATHKDAALLSAQQVLGSRWIQVLLTRCTRLSWNGAPVVGWTSLDPCLAAQRLAEAIAGDGQRNHLSKDMPLWRPPVLIVRCPQDADLMDTIGGTFVVFQGELGEQMECHDRLVYQRSSPATAMPVLLYYWGEGPEADQGWWFGPEIGGGSVWLHSTSDEKQPPSTGWTYPALGEDGGVQILHIDTAAMQVFGMHWNQDEFDSASDISEAQEAARGDASELEEDKAVVKEEEYEANSDEAEPHPMGVDASDVMDDEGLEGDDRDAMKVHVDDADVDDPVDAEVSPDVESLAAPPPMPLPKARPRPVEAPPAVSLEQVLRLREQTAVDREDKLREWLLGLDKGIGNMLQYFDALCAEFDGDLAQIAAVKVEGRPEKGLLGQVDPCFWDVVKVHKTGHRMLFGRGISML